MPPCQGPCARSTVFALVLLALATGVQLAPPGIPSAPSGELTAAGASNIAPPVKSGDATTTTVKSVPTSVSNDLLDYQKLEFLAVCLARDVKKPDVLLCNLYRNLTTVLTARKQNPVTVKTVQDMLAGPDASGGTDKFCENLTPVLQALREKATSGNERLQFEAKPLEREAVCANLCLPMDEVEFHLTLKPICRVLLWGFRQLLLPEPTAGETVEVQAAEKVVIPPLIDQGLKLEKVVEPKADTATKPVAAKPVQQTSAAATAHVTPSTNSASAIANAPPAREAAAKADEKDDSQKIATVEEKTLAEDEENGAFLDQETKNQQNIEDIVGGEGGVKENMDTGDEDAMYPGEDSDEDPSMDTNVPTAAGGAAVAAGSAPKEMAVREKQPEPLPRLDKEDLSLSDVQREELPVDPFFEEGDSNFFSYFLLVMFACIVSYVAYHNKSKLLALALEGRRSSTGRGGFSKGRKHTAAYRKLDSNLEEAIMSNSAASSRSQQQIIY
ncbi:uncharacterized protein LOC120432520 [Culex pipiens pallens]|uniref:uncharacterized protein LOC120432520 n=1 Tax=Culex pipiens pallens TaxID=42434 RepID=UPI001954D4B0|nr:uncharacterized protein LOC120432520 [Culex pipiens pallens]